MTVAFAACTNNEGTDDNGVSNKIEEEIQDQYSDQGCRYVPPTDNFENLPLYTNSSKVEIRAYVRSYLGEMKPPPEGYLENKKNRSSDPIEDYDENIVLSQIQKDSLFRLLLGFPDGSGCNPADCYFPRHKIHFYNDMDSLIGYIDICFQCQTTQTNIVQFQHVCDDQLNFYESFFKWVGITKGFGD